MRKQLLALAFSLSAATAALAQTATTLPYAAAAVADIGNGPIKVRMVQGNASIFTAQGSGVGSTVGSSTSLTLTSTPATAPKVGAIISGSGITSGTTIAAYNGTTGITLSAAMTVPASTALAWGASCPASAAGIPSQYITASVMADYYLLYTQARVCAVSPGGPANTLLTLPIFYDQTTPGGGASGLVVGSTTISGGASGRTLIDNGGTLQELAYSSSSSASSLVQRDANQNAFFNNYFANATSTVSASGTTVLTAASSRFQTLTGIATQTFQLPNATTLPIGPAFVFNNNSSGSLVITNAGGSTLYTVPAGGVVQGGATNVSTSNGTWDFHPYAPSTVTWGSGVTGLVMNSALSTTPSVSAGTPSATVPAFIPQRATPTTGFGGDSTSLYGIVSGAAVWTSTAAGTTFTGTVQMSAATLSGILTTNVTGGGTQCLQASNTGVVTGTGSGCASGGTPGGSSGQTQYNNAGAFGGYTMSGDATINTGTGALTLATANTSGAGTYGSAASALTLTADAKGRITGITSLTLTPAIANVTGLGTGIATALAVNTGSAGAPAILIAKGTSAMGTSAISSATCASVVTTAATGTATTDTVNASFNGDPTAVTGYVPLTTGMLTIVAYPTANNVNFKVCNNTSASITPGALTLNWIVVR